MKRRISYEFHGDHGWCTSNRVYGLKTDKQALELLEEFKILVGDKTLKAYKATTTFKEIKK